MNNKIHFNFKVNFAINTKMYFESYKIQIYIFINN